MSYNDRIELYKQIEKLRKKPLISFITSSRINAAAVMASDVIPEFTKQINEIPKTKKEIDILIISRGGDPTVSWRIISILRERFDKIGVLLPYEAYSAATLLALGADEIIMHPFSNLGPVDPQLVSIKESPGKPGQKEKILFGSEDLRHFLDFVRTDVGITDQEQMEKAFEFICRDVGSIQIGVAKKSSYLALSMGEKLLNLHMEDSSKAKAIAEALNKSFYHHGYPVGRKEAKEIGLPIKDPEEKLEKLMWQIWENIEKEMECNKPFNPLEIVLSNTTTSQLVGPVPQAQIPANLPPQVLQQAINQVMQQINIIQIPPVDYELFQATLESISCRSEFRTKGKITATRRPDMTIATNTIKTSQKWEFTKN
ncbi:hypothetical protein KJA15_00025 [Patescibacteria group bacterium]|nr:hypothetical protein [Patescibacteria group bacterium]